MPANIFVSLTTLPKEVQKAKYTPNRVMQNDTSVYLMINVIGDLIWMPQKAQKICILEG